MPTSPRRSSYNPGKTWPKYKKKTAAIRSRGLRSPCLKRKPGRLARSTLDQPRVSKRVPTHRTCDRATFTPGLVCFEPHEDQSRTQQIPSPIYAPSYTPTTYLHAQYALTRTHACPLHDALNNVGCLQEQQPTLYVHTHIRTANRYLPRYRFY